MELHDGVMIAEGCLSDVVALLAVSFVMYFVIIILKALSADD
jgi:hypothetical protein